MTIDLLLREYTLVCYNINPGSFMETCTGLSPSVSSISAALRSSPEAPRSLRGEERVLHTLTAANNLAYMVRGACKHKTAARCKVTSV